MEEIMTNTLQFHIYNWLLGPIMSQHGTLDI